ncbi:hypothetical protein H6503_01690 [Candidatus Woesearchaeota archaeon]|nr:hypothetical protein [Candidatus Woesearchaeota archaeon]
MEDFFLSGKNWQELVDYANKSDISPILLYPLSGFVNQKGISCGIICIGKEIGKAKSKSAVVVVKVGDDIRSVLEKNTSLHIYGMEFHSNKDFVHFRNSGLNQILVAIAKKNNHKFVFNFADFLKVKDSRKSKILGRVKQNMTMCKKAGVEYSFRSFATDILGIKDFTSLKKLLESNKAEEVVFGKD